MNEKRVKPCKWAILEWKCFSAIPFNTIEYRNCSIPKFQYYWIPKIIPILNFNITENNFQYFSPPYYLPLVKLFNDVIVTIIYKLGIEKCPILYSINTFFFMTPFILVMSHFHVTSSFFQVFWYKVQIWWEGQKIWNNLPHVVTKQLFLISSVKTSGRFFFKFLWPFHKNWTLWIISSFPQIDLLKFILLHCRFVLLI